MRKIKAFKARLTFGETDRYYIFLKEHLLELNPKYYVVAKKQKVMTEDGIMYAIRIVQDIEIPDLEVIAECRINSMFIYLWRDNCWAIATDKYQRPIIKNDNNNINLVSKRKLHHEQCNKTIVIHKVGVSSI